jgi:putative acetyltransferase
MRPTKEDGIVIRPEEPRDRDAVRELNEAAFGGTTEADLVEALHRRHAAFVALVAELDGEVSGHIMFSPVALEPATSLTIIGLGPMAVSPDRQRRGIGTALVREGLARCTALSAHAVVVVGHPGFYPRFGFRPGHRYGLRSEYDVPSEVFMALELVPGSLEPLSGLVRYHPAFAEA